MTKLKPAHDGDPIRAQMRAARQALGWSLEAAARQTGIPSVVLGSWERGDRSPVLPQLRRWAEQFHRQVVVLEPGERVVGVFGNAGEEWVSHLVVYGPNMDGTIDCDSEAEAEAIAAAMPGAKVGHRINRRGAIEFGGVW